MQLHDLLDAALSPQDAYRQQEQWAKEASPEGGPLDDLLDAALDPHWQDKQLAAARQRQEGQTQSLAERAGTRSVPFSSAIIGAHIDSRYRDARERFQARRATRGDAEAIALFERVRGEEQGRGVGGQVADALLNVPAILGEAAVSNPLFKGGATLAGMAARRAGQSLLMPSGFLPQASRRAVEQGGDLTDPQNLVPAVGLGAVQNMVLGSVGQFTKGIENPVTRFIAGVGVGMGEQAGLDVAAGVLDEFLPDVWQTKTRYGLLGDIARREGASALKHGVVQAVTFAAFQALHGNPGRGREIVQDVQESLDQSNGRGLSAEGAAKALQVRIDEFGRVFADEDRPAPTFQEEQARRRASLGAVGDGAAQTPPPAESVPQAKPTASGDAVAADGGSADLPVAERPAVRDSAVWRFADKLEAEATAELKALGLGDKLFAGGLDPAAFSAVARLTAAKILKAGLTVADFAKSALDQFGDAVRPYLDALWNAATEHATAARRAAAPALTARERHFLTEQAKGRTAESIGRDAIFRKADGTPADRGDVKSTGWLARKKLAAVDDPAALRAADLLEASGDPKALDAYARRHGLTDRQRYFLGELLTGRMPNKIVRDDAYRAAADTPGADPAVIYQLRRLRRALNIPDLRDVIRTAARTDAELQKTVRRMPPAEAPEPTPVPAPRTPPSVATAPATPAPVTRAPEPTAPPPPRPSPRPTRPAAPSPAPVGKGLPTGPPAQRLTGGSLEEVFTAARLTDNERQVMLARGDDAAQAALARDKGVTRQAIFNAERRAIAKIEAATGRRMASLEREVIRKDQASAMQEAREQAGLTGGRRGRTGATVDAPAVEAAKAEDRPAKGKVDAIRDTERRLEELSDEYMKEVERDRPNPKRLAEIEASIAAYLRGGEGVPAARAGAARGVPGDPAPGGAGHGDRGDVRRVGRADGGDPAPDVGARRSRVLETADRLEAQAADLFSQIGRGEMNFSEFAAGGKAFEALGKYVGAKILRGGYSLAQLTQDLGQRFGAEAAENAEAIWRQAQGVARAATISIANAFAQEERSRRNLPPAVQEASRSFGAVWDEAMGAAERGPELQDALIKDLAANPRAVTDREDALLLHRQVELQGRYDEAIARLEQARQSNDPVTTVEAEHVEAELRGRLQQLDDVNAKVGTETGRGLNARKMLAREDHSLARMTVQRQAAKGSELTPQERDEVTAAHKRIQELEAKLEARDAMEARRGVERAMRGNEQTLREIADDLIAQDAAAQADRLDLYTEAYDRLREFNVSAQTLSGFRRAGRDAASVRGIDEVAGDLAKRYPALFPESENPTDTLFRLLSEGKPQPLSRAEARSKAEALQIELDAVFGDAFEGEVAAPVRRTRVATARKEFDDAFAEFKRAVGGTFSNPFANPDALVAMVKVARAAVKLGTAHVRDFIAQVRERAGGEWTADREAVVTRAWDQAQADLGRERQQAALRRLEGTSPDDAARISRVARGLARDAVTGGIKDRDGVIAFVKQQLETVLPDITDRQTLDAIAGTGPHRTPTKTEVSEQLDDLRRQMKLVARLEDLRAGEAPTQASASRRVPSAEEQRLAEEVRALQRQAGATETKPERQRASALAAAKARMRQQIDDYADQVATGERKLRASGVVKPDAALATLTGIRDALKKDFDESFGKPGLSDADRLQRATSAAQRAVDDLTRRIEKRDLARRQNGIVAESPELQSLRTRRAALAAELEQLRAADPASQRSAEEQSLRAVKANLTRRIAEYQERLARGDFATPEKKPPQRDPDADRLRVALDQAKSEWRAGLQKAERANEGTFRKLARTAGHALDFERAIKLGGDLPPLLRQAGFVTLGRPALALRAFSRTAKTFASESSARQVALELSERPNARSGAYKRAMGLDVSEPARQDEFMDSSWIRKLPPFANLERWNSTFLTVLRADYFDALAASLGRNGKLTPGEERIVGNLVNVATGRGDLYSLERGVGILNQFLLAPKWVAARYQLALGQPLVRNLGEGSARVRIAVAKEYARTLTGIALVAGLAKLAGGDDVSIELDPRSSDWGQMRIGNLRLNPLFGVQQVVTALARLGSGRTKSTATGAVKPNDRATELGRQLRSKLAPIPGAVWTATEIATGTKPPPGFPTTYGGVAADLAMPITAKDFFEATDELGLPRGVAVWMWGSLGGGIKVHDPKKPDRKPVGR